MWRLLRMEWGSVCTTDCALLDPLGIGVLLTRESAHEFLDRWTLLPLSDEKSSFCFAVGTKTFYPVASELRTVPKDALSFTGEIFSREFMGTVRIIVEGAM